MKEEIIPIAGAEGCIDAGVAGRLLESDCSEVFEALWDRVPRAGGNAG
jgi:hypothetical protein